MLTDALTSPVTAPAQITSGVTVGEGQKRVVWRLRR